MQESLSLYSLISEDIINVYHSPRIRYCFHVIASYLSLFLTFVFKQLQIYKLQGSMSSPVYTTSPFLLILLKCPSQSTILFYFYYFYFCGTGV
jgi:hypothetical protein